MERAVASQGPTQALERLRARSYVLTFAALAMAVCPTRGWAQAGAKRLAEHAYYEYEVEQPVSPAKKMPSPQYPAPLRPRGIDGTVLAQFVVDTSGKADMSTFQVQKSTDPLFSEAVRAYVAAGVWVPAQRGGKKVRQIVQQPFAFRAPRF